MSSIAKHKYETASFHIPGQSDHPDIGIQVRHAICHKGHNFLRIFKNLTSVKYLTNSMSDPGQQGCIKSGTNGTCSRQTWGNILLTAGLLVNGYGHVGFS